MSARDTRAKVGISIDEWKLPIFERHLSSSGYTFVRAPGLTAETMFLMVDTENVEALGAVVLAANTEAAGVGEKQ